MDPNWLLVWISGVGCTVNLLIALRPQRSPAWGWRVILSLILITLGVCWNWFPETAGYVVGPLWFLFVFLPGLLMRQVNQKLSRHQYRRALWVAKLAQGLHPFDGWPQQTQLVHALELFERGKPDEASRLIARLGAVETTLGRTARLIQAQQTGDWQELLEDIDRRYSPEAVLRSETLLMTRLQALGELGRPEEMLHLVQSLLDAPEDRSLSPLSQAILQMRVAALAGQVTATEQQLTTLTSIYPADVREYWRLTAHQVAGEEQVREGFRKLEGKGSCYLRPMIERRISQPLPTFDVTGVSPQTSATIERLADLIRSNVQSAIWLDDGSGRPWATWMIALGLILNFLREIPDGGWNPNTWRYLNNLKDLGALVIPQSSTPGEWWRVLTAGFLHFGPVHLGLNLLGLLVFGPRLERAWGRWPMVICYLSTTIASMALAPLITQLPENTPFLILAGASGGVMGLVGGLVGYMLVGWILHRHEHLRNPLLFLGMIVVLQTSFDLSTENVSFESHALGLGAGIAFGTAWTWLTRREKAQ